MQSITMISELRYLYQTIEIGELEIHIRSLRDTCEYQDDNDEASDVGINDTLWSIFGVLWPCSSVLANLVNEKETKDLKILEVGCGLALSSIVLSLKGADITVTDYNPASEEFLSENTRINKCNEIPFVRADWNHDISKLGRFDLIIGSDLLYERGHASSLSNFINNHSKETCEVIIVDPNRGNQNDFTKEMEQLNFKHNSLRKVFLDHHKFEFKGQIHSYTK